ncbi:glycoside hydrolase family 88 protein [Niabella aurantiaca]|uniref:glycoside hydrolase family 88 protein n=1 Tax=Niabella aurantiaca TaxID=379900 RepID=UPI0003A58CEE|nr:glycoside hydrolase family 88 protein [Niabella aurantiaca]
MKSFLKPGITAGLVCFFLSAAAQKDMRTLIRNNEVFAANQYKLLMKNTPPDKMPQNYDPAKDKLVASGTAWWTSGFYPGTLWLIYKATKDPEILTEAKKRLVQEAPMQYYTGNHDIGFMIFCSFGNAYAITKDPHYKEVILTAAETATKRYRQGMKAIQSWNKSKKFNAPVIIDNMMNLELLEWASRNGGSKLLAEIAENHANTTLKNHFRPDGSSYHAVDYDTATGAVLKKVTHQGYADESAWARGQAWALYGYTMMYRFTKKPEYLAQAHKIAAFILDHPNLPEDKVPYWDFNAPDIPNAPRDVSAAAVMASALLELAQYSNPKQKASYRTSAATMIRSMATTYRSQPGGSKGFILTRSVGNLPGRSEVNVSLSYADYYFMEALDRYKRWVLK